MKKVQKLNYKFILFHVKTSKTMYIKFKNGITITNVNYAEYLIREYLSANGLTDKLEIFTFKNNFNFYNNNFFFELRVLAELATIPKTLKVLNMKNTIFGYLAEVKLSKENLYKTVF